MAYRPLADEIRPQTLDEVVGQKHILGREGLLRRIIEGGDIPNLIFYGPSGTGKTTVANIIARRTNRPLHRLNATTASISDIKEIIADIGTLMAPEGVLLYRDRSYRSERRIRAVPFGNRKSAGQTERHAGFLPRHRGRAGQTVGLRKADRIRSRRTARSARADGSGQNRSSAR